MTCLLNYTPDESQSELQHLAVEAEAEHRQAHHFHDTIFSSRSGYLKAHRLADQLQDTLWALSVVYSRALTDQVRLGAAVTGLSIHALSLQCTFSNKHGWVDSRG